VIAFYVPETFLENRSRVSLRLPRYVSCEKETRYVADQNFH
jgi:hypothetical protein